MYIFRSVHYLVTYTFYYAGHHGTLNKHHNKVSPETDPMLDQHRRPLHGKLRMYIYLSRITKAKRMQKYMQFLKHDYNKFLVIQNFVIFT